MNKLAQENEDADEPRLGNAPEGNPSRKGLYRRLGFVAIGALIIALGIRTLANGVRVATEHTYSGTMLVTGVPPTVSIPTNSVVRLRKGATYTFERLELAMPHWYKPGTYIFSFRAEGVDRYIRLNLASMELEEFLGTTEAELRSEITARLRTHQMDFSPGFSRSGDDVRF